MRRRGAPPATRLQCSFDEETHETLVRRIAVRAVAAALPALGAERGDVRLPGHGGSVPLRAGERRRSRRRPATRSTGAVRRRRRRDQRDGLGRRADRRGRLGRHRAAISQGRTSSCSGSSTTSASPRRWSRATARGINSVADLKGKKIAMPFVSTTHFQLMVALQQGRAQAGRRADPQHAAAGNRARRGSAATSTRRSSGIRCSPKVKKNGKVIMTSGDICKEGACTFDGSIVTTQVGQGEPGLHGRVRQGARQGRRRLRAQPGKWTGDSAEVKAVAKWSGGKPEDVPTRWRSTASRRLQEQARPTWLGGGANGAAAKALTQQANFLKEQGRMQTVAPDYSQVRDHRVGDARR